MVLRTLTAPNFNVFRIVTICFVTKSPPFTCSVPLLRCPQWLPVKFRLLFNISLLTYKTLHEKQPVYLHSMLAPPLPSCSLRSSKGIRLSVSRVKTNTGARAFRSHALSLWNNLPLSVRSAISVCYLQETSEDISL